MSFAAQAALIFASIWIGVLTVVCMLLVRQLGLVTVRLDRASDRSAPVQDGLDVGAPIPPTLASALPHANGEGFYLLIVGAMCGPCRELADDLHDTPDDRRVIAIVSGHEEHAQSLAAMLPPAIEVVRDPLAARVVELLEVEITPFVFEIKLGRVTGKAAIRDADHFLAFLAAGIPSSPRTNGSPTLEVSTYGQ